MWQERAVSYGAVLNGIGRDSTLCKRPANYAFRVDVLNAG
jgi:hypothetical protein